MKNCHRIISTLIAGCLIGMLTPSFGAAIDEKDFDALKELVTKQGDLLTKQGQRIEQLENGRQQDRKALDDAKKVHDQDQQQIEQLKQQMGETQKTVSDVASKADAATAKVTGPAASHNFTMVGDAEVQFGKVQGQHSAFELADFAPIFLYRARDNVLFEAGFDINLQNNAPNGTDATTSIGLSFAQLDYLINDYVTFVGGYMLLPLGTYTERGAGWINKIPDDPLARDVLPSNGAGIQFRGAIPFGSRPGEHLTYAIYGANGPGATGDGTGASTNLDLGGNVGIRSDGSTGNLHSSPSAGGRVGWFYPWKAHYDIELGVSGQSGTWDNKGTKLWSGGVVDAALHISPYFELKGEYIHSWVDSTDVGTFTPHGWWIQGAYKLSGLNLEVPLINNLELVGRYDTVKDGLGTHTERGTVGYVYYISNTFQFMGDYEFVHSNDPSQDHNAFMFQLALGF